MDDAVAALRDLYDWCHNNVAYFPETKEAQAIARRVEAALKAHSEQGT